MRNISTKEIKYLYMFDQCGLSNQVNDCRRLKNIQNTDFNNDFGAQGN